VPFAHRLREAVLQVIRPIPIEPSADPQLEGAGRLDSGDFHVGVADVVSGSLGRRSAYQTVGRPGADHALGARQNRRGNAQTDGAGGFHVSDDLRVAGRFDLSLIAASTRLFIVAMSRCALRNLTL
jgi:hypothetical protein